MKSRTLFFTAPTQVEIREHSLSTLKDDEVLVETVSSAISAGTELLVYRGQLPHVRDAHDNLSSELDYPLAYGYACAGMILETGKNVDKNLRDKLVFGFQPHTTHFITQPSSLLMAPDSISAETCCFLPNIETAVNLVQDAAPLLGERVMVIGQGVVGLLVTSLLKEFPLESLVTSDCYAIRRTASLDIGADRSFDPESTNEQEKNNPSNTLGTETGISKYLLAYAKNFDLAFELSGSPSALDDAIEMTSFNGRIVIGSWYGEKKAPINLGGAFHRSRIKLISSQVSTIAPELSGRWDKARRFQVAWEALKRIQPEKWITHRFSIDEAAKAYELLDKNPGDTIQVVFNYQK